MIEIQTQFLIRNLQIMHIDMYVLDIANFIYI